ncbi:PH domain-containing protein [Bacillus sp. AK031]
MRFYSKKGVILFPILILVLLVMIFTTLIQFVEVEFVTNLLGEPEGEGTFAGVIVPVLAAILIIWLMFATYYEINGNVLKVAAGPLRYKIDITSIKSVKPTRNPLSSPALSIDRLEIKYNKWNTVLISPKDKERFIEELVKINPAIEVKNRTIRFN